MLGNGKVFKIPQANGQSKASIMKGCNYYNGNYGFSCSPYGSDCIDMSYSKPSPSCGWGLGITAVGSVAAVAALT